MGSDRDARAARLSWQHKQVAVHESRDQREQPRDPHGFEATQNLRKRRRRRQTRHCRPDGRRCVTWITDNGPGDQIRPLHGRRAGRPRRTTQAAALRGARTDQARTDAGNHRGCCQYDRTADPNRPGRERRRNAHGRDRYQATILARGSRRGSGCWACRPDLRRDRGPRSRRDPPASACTTTRPRECIRNREGDKCPDEPTRPRGNTRRAAGVTSPIPSAPMTPERCGHVEQGTVRSSRLRSARRGEYPIAVTGPTAVAAATSASGNPSEMCMC